MTHGLGRRVAGAHGGVVAAEGELLERGRRSWRSEVSSSASGASCSSPMLVMPREPRRLTVTGPMPEMAPTGMDAQATVHVVAGERREAAGLLELGGQLGEQPAWVRCRSSRRGRAPRS